MSFILKVIKSEGGEIRLIIAQENSKDCWFYVRMNPGSYSEYKSKMKKGDLNIRDYGEILFSGWGKTPPEDIKQKVAALNSQN